MSLVIPNPSRRPPPEFALTASGRTVELPPAAGGNPLCVGHPLNMLDEARAAIRVGDLGEALLWIERATPALAGLRALAERTLNGEA